MKDFLNGKAVRVRTRYASARDQQALRDFMVWCDGYGLAWADGSPPTAWCSMDGGDSALFRFVLIDPMSGALVASTCPPKEGFKDLAEVRPLRYTFGHFVNGDIALSVRKSELNTFLDMATKNKMLWANGLPPRVAMRGRKLAKSAVTFAPVPGANGKSRRFCIAHTDQEGSIKGEARGKLLAIDFRYIPRNYEGTYSTTLDAARESRRRNRAVAEGGSYIQILSRPGSPKVSAVWHSEGPPEPRRAVATCAPDDTFAFATGAAVALARLVGREAWGQAVEEASIALEKDATRTEPVKRLPISIDGREINKLSKDELRLVIDEILRLGRERKVARS